jgi:hypothetical protein
MRGYWEWVYTEGWSATTLRTESVPAPCRTTPVIAAMAPSGRRGYQAKDGRGPMVATMGCATSSIG